MKYIQIGKVKIYGKHQNQAALIREVEKIVCDPSLRFEGAIRLALQDAMERTDCPMSMLYDGNGVYPYTKTLRDFRRVIKANSTHKMTKHLYQFFNLCTGTIAHYNLQGWACIYPDNDSLRALFNRNEYGYRVVDYIPEWKTDVKRIVSVMELILKGAVR